jgi:hypothetical protein
MTPEEIKAAAGEYERLRNVTVREKLHGGYSRLATILADAYLAHLAADSAERVERVEREKPIDEEWLLDLGFSPLMCGGIGLMHQNGQVEHHQDGRWVVNCLAYNPRHFTTRGQLLDLLKSLGIKPTN